MQKTDGTHLPDNALLLSTQEGNDLRAKSLKDILALEEKNDLFKQGEIALKINPNARTTFSGRVIQNNRGGLSLYNGDNQKIDKIFTQMAFAGLSMGALYELTSKIASLASIFTPSVSAKSSPPIAHTDGQNIFDTERVSAQTYKMLKQESLMIEQREMEISSIQDPDLYMRELQEFAELANSLDMRPHPLTGQFVHCAERVREIEAENLEKSTLIEPPIHNVAVFRSIPPVVQTANLSHAPQMPHQTLDLTH